MIALEIPMAEYTFTFVRSYEPTNCDMCGAEVKRDGYQYGVYWRIKGGGEPVHVCCNCKDHFGFPDQ